MKLHRRNTWSRLLMAPELFYSHWQVGRLRAALLLTWLYLRGNE